MSSSNAVFRSSAIENFSINPIELPWLETSWNGRSIKILARKRNVVFIILSGE